MARRITLTAPLHEPRQDFVERLKNTSDEHAEALLDGYELLQQLHERGVFAVLRGAVAAGDKLVNAATEAVDSPQVVAGICNLIVMGKALGAMDPLAVRRFARAVDETMSGSTSAAKPPSLLSLLGHFRRPEVRRGIALVNHFLAALGSEAESVKAEKRIAGNPRAA